MTLWDLAQSWKRDTVLTPHTTAKERCADELIDFLLVLDAAWNQEINEFAGMKPRDQYEMGVFGGRRAGRFLCAQSLGVPFDRRVVMQTATPAEVEQSKEVLGGRPLGKKGK